MTYKENIRAILECYFTGFKREIIDSACNRILEQESCDKYIKEIDHLRRYISKLETQIVEQEPYGDSISRQVVLEVLKDKWNAFSDANDAMQESIDTIEVLPPVNPQRMGHWIFDEILDKHYYCSECKSMGVDYWDFCPNCGAKMVETQERSDKE